MRASATASAQVRRHRPCTGERQREIVTAVFALARGPDAITTQAVAERMIVTQDAVFRHFPGKEALLLGGYRGRRTR